MDEGDTKIPTGVHSWVPTLPYIYINDFKPGLSLIVSLFVDDCAIFMVITSAKDCDNLQAEQLYYWVQL